MMCLPAAEDAEEAAMDCHVVKFSLRLSGTLHRRLITAQYDRRIHGEHVSMHAIITALLDISLPPDPHEVS